MASRCFPKSPGRHPRSSVSIRNDPLILLDTGSGTATSNPCHCSCAGGSTTHSCPEAPTLSWFSKGRSAEAVAWWEPTGILFLVGLC